MSYTLKEIFDSIEQAENGANMVNDLKKEIQKLRDESAEKRNEKKKLLEDFGLSDESEEERNNIKAILNEIKKKGNNPSDFGSKLNSLSKQVESLTLKAKQAEEKAEAEKTKRIAEIKNSKTNSIAAKLNAVNPEIVTKLLLDKINYKDDDSIVFKNGEEEIDIETGVKNFLEANPYLVKVNQQTGSNSSSNDSIKNKIYTSDEIKNMSTDEINQNWDSIQKSI